MATHPNRLCQHFPTPHAGVLFLNGVLDTILCLLDGTMGAMWTSIKEGTFDDVSTQCTIPFQAI